MLQIALRQDELLIANLKLTALLLVVNSKLCLLPLTSKLTNSRDRAYVAYIIIVVLAVVLLWDTLFKVFLVFSAYCVQKIHSYCQLYVYFCQQLLVALRHLGKSFWGDSKIFYSQKGASVYSGMQRRAFQRPQTPPNKMCNIILLFLKVNMQPLLLCCCSSANRLRYLCYLLPEHLRLAGTYALYYTERAECRN